MKTLALAGIGSQVMLLSNCTALEPWPILSTDQFTPQQAYIILNIQEVLFPDDGNGPSNKDIQSFEHLLWKLTPTYSEKGTIAYFNKGFQAVEKKINSYLQDDIRALTAENWQMLVLRLTEDKSTEKWLSGMLTTILEALTLDPIYNINTNNVGWDWLEHQTGFPQPTEENKFPNFYNDQDLA